VELGVERSELRFTPLPQGVVFQATASAKASILCSAHVAVLFTLEIELLLTVGCPLLRELPKTKLPMSKCGRKRFFFLELNCAGMHPLFRYAPKSQDRQRSFKGSHKL
jgi:hypothetical protein